MYYRNGFTVIETVKNSSFLFSTEISLLEITLVQRNAVPCLKMLIGSIVIKMNIGRRRVLFVPMQIIKQTTLIHDFPFVNRLKHIYRRSFSFLKAQIEVYDKGTAKFYPYMIVRNSFQQSNEIYSKIKKNPYFLNKQIDDIICSTVAHCR
jgi:hypothetical protein